MRASIPNGAHTATRPVCTQGRVFAVALLLAVGAFGCQSVRMLDGSLQQRGSVSVPHEGEVDVYYPTPYISPPNLETDSSFNDHIIVEQKPDHFRVKNTELFPCDVSWTARGKTAAEPQVSVNINQPVASGIVSVPVPAKP